LAVIEAANARISLMRWSSARSVAIRYDRETLAALVDE
jgi:hypothetical protein